MPTVSKDVKQVIDIIKTKQSNQIVKINKLNKIFRQNPKLANQIGLIINKYADAEVKK